VKGEEVFREIVIKIWTCNQGTREERNIVRKNDAVEGSELCSVMDWWKASELYKGGTGTSEL
jgi:hypothetical protein